MKISNISLITVAALMSHFGGIPSAEAETKQGLRTNVSFSEVLAAPFARPDLRISYADAPMQFVENWQVPQRQATTPVIISIHGGCWLNAYAIDHTYAMNSALRDAGFEVWSVEYRRVGDEGGGWPGSFEDVQAAIHTVVGHYGNSQTFAQRDVTLLGHSAGGHLALLAAGQNEQLIDRVVGLAAITNIVAYAAGENSCQQAGNSFMADVDEQGWQAANPYAKELSVPAFLFHGEADTIVPRAQSEAFVEQGKAAVTWLADAGHFDVIDPQSRAWLTIVNELKALSTNN